MKYPIDVEKYIAAMRLEFGPSETAEQVHREVIPLVNTAYKGGLDGKAGYPKDANEEISGLEKHYACLIDSAVARIVANIVNWCNRAYEQGHQDAQKAVGA